MYLPVYVYRHSILKNIFMIKFFKHIYFKICKKYCKGPKKYCKGQDHKKFYICLCSAPPVFANRNINKS